jgi:hypothetical protein
MACSERCIRPLRWGCEVSRRTARSEGRLSADPAWSLRLPSRCGEHLREWREHESAWQLWEELWKSEGTWRTLKGEDVQSELSIFGREDLDAAELVIWHRRLVEKTQLTQERAWLGVGGQDRHVDGAVVSGVNDFETEVRQAEVVDGSNRFQMRTSHRLRHLVEVRILTPSEGESEEGTDRHGVQKPGNNFLHGLHLMKRDVMDQSLLSHLL